MNDHKPDSSSLLDEAATGNIAYDHGPQTEAGSPSGNFTQVGAPTPGNYGCEVAPLGPVQNMFAIDPIAGPFPPRDRNSQPGDFTGGNGGQGLGGQGLPPYPGGETDTVLPNTVYERRGF